MNENLFGTYVKIPLNHTKYELEKAREKVIEEMCEAIRKMAQETPEEVFIEKDHHHALDGEFHTVGCKMSIFT